jgi:dodecin
MPERRRFNFLPSEAGEVAAGRRGQALAVHADMTPPPLRGTSPTSLGRKGMAQADRTPGILALTRAARVVSFSRHNREGQMSTNRTYVKTEVVGSSDKSVSDAIESAIAVASRSLRNLDWFEVIDVRGNIRDNKVANYQVTLKLGLRYEPKM